jgi:DNA-binding PadR family transcriptional regulator
VIPHHDPHFGGGPRRPGGPGGFGGDPGRHGGPGGFGGGPGGFGGGRGRRRRGEIRGALLMLLADEARNGYQLMQAIEERSGGRWRPSPGSVYPTLAQLEDEGLIRAIERDGNKLFELTDDGREHVSAHHPDAPPWCSGDDPAGDVYVELRSLVAQTAQAAVQVAKVGNVQQVKHAQQLLAQTRRSLYGILAGDDDE